MSFLVKAAQGTGCWLYWHIAKCTNVERRKRSLPKYVGLSEKIERIGREVNSGLGDPQAVRLQTEMRPGTTRRHSQWGSPLGTSVGKEHGAPAGICLVWAG